MDITAVKSLFRLFSQETSTDYDAVVEMAVSEVGSMLKENADTEDVRLNFLSAALANYRYRQILGARDRSKVTYAGKMADAVSNDILKYAESLFRDYLAVCRELVKPSDFIFMSF
jgi:hypothetical protein